MSDDPMLDGITRWTAFESLGGLFQGMNKRPTGKYVLFSDLPALIARVREGERKSCVREYAIDYEQGHRDGYDKGVQHERERSATLIADAYGRGYLKGEQDERGKASLDGDSRYAKGYEQGQRDEREVCIADIYRTCGHTKYEGCAPCAHDDAVAAIRARGEKP